MLRITSVALIALTAFAPAGVRGEDASPPAASTEAAAEEGKPATAKQGAALEAPAAMVENPEVAGAPAARENPVAAVAPEVPESPVKATPRVLGSSWAAGGMPRWGLALGGGFPDFATASLVFRPVSRVRLSAGPAWNYAGWGAQGGVALVPFNFWIAPIVSLEAGRFFRTNLGFLAKDSGGVPADVKPLLEKIDYSYAALDLGLELGSQRGFSSSIRLGLSYVSLAAHGSATYTSDDGTQVSISSPAIHGTVPSVKLGFQYWF